MKKKSAEFQFGMADNILSLKFVNLGERIDIISKKYNNTKLMYFKFNPNLQINNTI